MTVPNTTQAPPTDARTGRIVEPIDELTFRVTIQGRTIGRFAECEGLAVEYEVMPYAEGGNNEFVHQLRGHVRYPNVTLSRGVTYEDELLRWFYANDAPSQRPTVTIALTDQLGATVRQFALSGALPVRWNGPSTAAGSSGAATESLEIAHRGFV
jgi:phage tail-like protein